VSHETQKGINIVIALVLSAPIFFIFWMGLTVAVEAYQQTVHNLASRGWPQQMGVVNRTGVMLEFSTSKSGLRKQNFTPIIYMNYRVGDREYHDVALTNQMSPTNFDGTRSDAESYAQNMYPVGRQLIILIDPENPAEPRMVGSIWQSIPWRDLLILLAVYGGGLFTLFLIKTITLQSRDDDVPTDPNSV
jgi:hypothetical protein